MAAALRVAAVIHGAMGTGLILGGMLLLNSLPYLIRAWAAALILAPAIGLGMVLLTAASQEMQAAKRQGTPSRAGRP